MPKTASGESNSMFYYKDRPICVLAFMTCSSKQSLLFSVWSNWSWPLIKCLKVCTKSENISGDTHMHVAQCTYHAHIWDKCIWWEKAVDRYHNIKLVLINLFSSVCSTVSENQRNVSGDRLTVHISYYAHKSKDLYVWYVHHMVREGGGQISQHPEYRFLGPPPSGPPSLESPLSPIMH